MHNRVRSQNRAAVKHPWLFGSQSSATQATNERQVVPIQLHASESRLEHQLGCSTRANCSTRAARPVLRPYATARSRQALSTTIQKPVCVSSMREAFTAAGSCCLCCTREIVKVPSRRKAPSPFDHNPRRVPLRARRTPHLPSASPVEIQTSRAAPPRPGRGAAGGVRHAGVRGGAPRGRARQGTLPPRL